MTSSFKNFLKDKTSEIYKGLVKTDQGDFEYNVFAQLIATNHEFTLRNGELEIKSAVLHNYNNEEYITFITSVNNQKNKIFNDMNEANNIQELCNITNRYIDIYPNNIMTTFIESAHKLLVNKHFF